MYIRIWDKYLNVIRILLKRAFVEEQTFQLNISDFQKTAVARKTGYKFTIEFRNGMADNLIGLPEIAKDFTTVLLSDPIVKELLLQNEFHISMNRKFQLMIKRVSVLTTEAEVPSHEAIAE